MQMADDDVLSHLTKYRKHLAEQIELLEKTKYEVDETIEDLKANLTTDDSTPTVTDREDENVEELRRDMSMWNDFFRAVRVLKTDGKQKEVNAANIAAEMNDKSLTLDQISGFMRICISKGFYAHCWRGMRATKGRCFLHEDLIIEILLRLPVKSLSRFKSVCQRWHIIIKSPRFIRNHFHQNSSTYLLVYWGGVLWNQGENNNRLVNALSLIQLDETLIRYDLDRQPIGPISAMQGPCNGVFCVLDFNGTLALWNPGTRMLRPVSPLPLKGQYGFSFGKDRFTDDIKIVFVEQNFRDPNFAIYNVSNKSWRLLIDNALIDHRNAHMLATSFRPAYSNGFCYWMKSTFRTSLHYSILAFDIHNESFEEIEMPSETLKSDVERVLHRHDDSLALISGYYVGSTERCFDMWLMKEQGCWTKISTVVLPFLLTALGWKRNHVLALTCERKLIIYDNDSGKTKKLKFRRMENAYFSRLFVCPYKESLVPL